jgi:hypothetical protein
LASHGYVVAGIGHLFDTPTLTLPNGRVVQPARPDSGANLFVFTRALIESRAADLLFVGRQLLGMDMSTVFASGRISPRRVAVIGHSRGGVAALEACKRDAMFRACINLDGGVVGGPYYPDPDSLAPRAPTLWFQAFHPPPSDAQLAGLRLSRAQWDSFDLRANHLIARARGGGWRITLPDTSHYAFADAVLTASGAQNAAHNAQTLATVRRITRAFLEATFEETSGDAVRQAIEAARGVTGIQIRGDSNTGNGNGRVPYPTSNSFRRARKMFLGSSCLADHLPRSCSWRRDGTLSLGKDRWA